MTGGWAQALEAHEHRRRQGFPTVTFLAGPPAIGERVFCRWLEGAGRAAAVTRGSEVSTAEAAASAYAAALPQAAWRARAAASASPVPDELLRALDRKTGAERDLAVDALSAAPAARALLLGEPATATLGLRALHALFPPAAAPGVVLVGGRGLAAAARTAAALVEEVPELTLAVAGDGDARSAGDRAYTLLRQGAISVAPLTPDSVRDRLAGELAAVARAAEARDDAARSAAERFLADCLELMNETSGRFAQNADPGFRFGGRRAEVDLLCRSLGVAIEVDGWHHFQDDECYRRDRRKDLELQRHGFLVLRFLAADVVPRLETILATILEAVRFAADRRR